MEIIFIVLFSYISGSVPYGLIVTKSISGKDIRNIGSGNIGATNVLRTGKKFLAFLTLLLDILKGYLPVLIVSKYFPEFINISCLATFLGHVFPIWLRFKGGKGVATYLGILFALSIQLGLLFIFSWLVVSLIFRYSSLSSMFASLTVFIVNAVRETFYPIILNVTNQSLDYQIRNLNSSFILFVFLILIIFTHRKNIYNLKNKSEPKIKI